MVLPTVVRISHLKSRVCPFAYPKPCRCTPCATTQHTTARLGCLRRLFRGPVPRDCHGRAHGHQVRGRHARRLGAQITFTCSTHRQSSLALVLLCRGRHHPTDLYHGHVVLNSRAGNAGGKGKATNSGRDGSSERQQQFDIGILFHAKVRQHKSKSRL